MAAIKRCSRCRKMKPVDDFGVKASGLYGRQAYCHQCARAKAAEIRRRKKRRREIADGVRYRPTRQQAAAYAARKRARRKAVAALVERHPDEFENLYRYHRGQARHENW